MIKTTVATTLFALLLCCDNAQAITVDLEPAKDNTLYESFNGIRSNGAGTHFFTGRTQQGSDETRRGLIQFDIANELPESATITSATLTMRVSKVANTLGDSIQLRRVAADWGEAGSVAGGGGGGGATAHSGDATWKHRFSPNSTWTNLGGDFSSVVSASTSVGSNASYDWSSQQLADDIQDMLDTPNGNFGWIVLGNETFSGTAKRFDSRESLHPPVLTIEYMASGCSSPDADFDGDCDVDGDDLGDWQSAYGPNSGGDADSDNDTDGADFLVWQQEFTGPSSTQTASVPEPTSTTLMLAFLVLGVLNRQGRGLRS